MLQNAFITISLTIRDKSFTKAMIQPESSQSLICWDLKCSNTCGFAGPEDSEEQRKRIGFEFSPT